MLDAEPDVLADPGAADLALSDRISDPACGHVEIRRGFVDRQQRSLLRRRTRLTTPQGVGSTSYSLKDTVIID
jgi:hypothetical protein